MPKTQRTVLALVDSAIEYTATAEIIHRIEEVEIPVITQARHCTHTDTLCPDCYLTWQLQYLITERLPWEKPDTPRT